MRAVSDAPGIQELQVSLLAGELRGRVQYFQPFGLSAVPLAGAEAAVVFPGGDRGHGIAVAVDDPRYRPHLNPGESCLYNAKGVKITLLDDNTIEITGATLTKINGNLRVTGEITDRCATDGLSMANMRTKYNDHTHDENDNGGPTDEPDQQMV